MVTGEQEPQLSPPSYGRDNPKAPPSPKVAPSRGQATYDRGNPKTPPSPEYDGDNLNVPPPAESRGQNGYGRDKTKAPPLPEKAPSHGQKTYGRGNRKTPPLPEVDDGNKADLNSPTRYGRVDPRTPPSPDPSAHRPPIVERLTDRFPAIPITRGMNTLYGASNIHISSNGSYVDISLDKSTGSGLVSKNTYYHGFFSAAIKVPKGITSGVVLAFYEEKKGSTSGSTPLTTFINTPFFGTATILLDNIPIREIINKGAISSVYPLKPMSLYATIWDGSKWATKGGKYPTNYKYAPFVASFGELKIEGCVTQNASLPTDVNFTAVCGSLTSPCALLLKELKHQVFNLIVDKFTNEVECLEPLSEGFVFRDPSMVDVGTGVVDEVKSRDIGTEMTPLGSSTTSRCPTIFKSLSPHNTPASRSAPCSRYQREEAKIQAWVDLQNAKAEAQSRKLEHKETKDLAIAQRDKGSRAARFRFLGPKTGGTHLRLAFSGDLALPSLFRHRFDDGK
ncbi:hypothetical protein L6452_17671 [Arctium lappa]|uniref:Uncharacterized protein n=1 Tax=Arctium lappa TaxID=4217 RepID=A0ACB9C475_ARCLA|nr:hypothetical protein L6452_17671 [Arctium lappa]